MQLAIVQKVLGLLLALFSFSMLLPIAVSIFYQEGATSPFINAFLVSLTTGLILWLPVRDKKKELRLRDAF